LIHKQKRKRGCSENDQTLVSPMDKDLQGYPHRIPTGWSTWLGNNRNVAGQKTRYDLQASRRLGFRVSPKAFPQARPRLS
ncbi:hypothetical protein ACIPM3_32560, partial [Pseudomonas aeruginosa]